MLTKQGANEMNKDVMEIFLLFDNVRKGITRQVIKEEC